jgi:hypothetical protein
VCVDRTETRLTSGFPGIGTVSVNKLARVGLSPITPFSFNYTVRESLMNRNVLLTGISLVFALASQSALAANANTTQKGSLLIYPKIDVRKGVSTWVRLVNDSKLPVTVKCYYMDVEKHRVDFEFPLTKNQPMVFDAATGIGPSRSVNAFPQGTNYPGYGELICFAVNFDGTAAAHHDQLSGTATIADTNVVNGTTDINGASEYSAWSFRYNANGTNEPPLGDLKLTGEAGGYDSCPAYLMGQFSPSGAPAPGDKIYGKTTISISSCKQDLRQDFDRNDTKLQFDVWKYDETRLTGAYHCSNSFAETALDDVGTARQNFSAALLKEGAYYRVQGVESTQCLKSKSAGLVGVQTSLIPGLGSVTTELAASNNGVKDSFIRWDASSPWMETPVE